MTNMNVGRKESSKLSGLRSFNLNSQYLNLRPPQLAVICNDSQSHLGSAYYGSDMYSILFNL